MHFQLIEDGVEGQACGPRRCLKRAWTLKVLAQESCFSVQKNTATAEDAGVLALHDPLKATFILN